MKFHQIEVSSDPITVGSKKRRSWDSCFPICVHFLALHLSTPPVCVWLSFYKMTGQHGRFEMDRRDQCYSWGWIIELPSLLSPSLSLCLSFTFPVTCLPASHPDLSTLFLSLSVTLKYSHSVIYYDTATSKLFSTCLSVCWTGDLFAWIFLLILCQFFLHVSQQCLFINTHEYLRVKKFGSNPT